MADPANFILRAHLDDSDATPPFIYTTEGLPAGLTQDTTTGDVTGIPTVSSTGKLTFTSTTADKKTFSLAIPYRLNVQSTPVTPTPPVVTPVATQIKTLQGNYTNILAKPALSSYQLGQAMAIYLQIVQLLEHYPRKANMDLMTSWMRTYKDTYFQEAQFFQGLYALTTANQSLVSDVYSAFRNITNTPNLTFNTSALASHPNCGGIVDYITSYSRSGSIVAPTPQPTQTGPGNTTIPEALSGISGTYAMQVGGQAYDAVLAGNAVISFVRDPDLTFPGAANFFIESTVYIETNGNALTLDSSVAVSKETGLVANGDGSTPVLTAGDGSTHAVLKIASFSEGSSWVVLEVDRF